MKKIQLLYMFSLIMLMLGGLVSCDKIDEADYLKPVGNQDWLGQRVLIEDFTGMRCPNCPDAAKVAFDLQELYPEKVIVIANHVNLSMNPTNGSPDSLTCQAGDDYSEKYAKNAALPSGMINRQASSSTSKLFDKGKWAEEVSKLIHQTPSFKLEIQNTYNVSIKELKVVVTATAVKSIDANYKLVVLITESNIIAPQKSNTGTISNYVHQHVLRTSVTSASGTDFINGLVNKGALITKQFNITIPDRWERGGHSVPANCSVVAFLSDPTDDSIIQVAEAKVID